MINIHDFSGHRWCNIEQLCLSLEIVNSNHIYSFLSYKSFTQYYITRILSGALINANLDHSTLIYLALINVTNKFS